MHATEPGFDTIAQRSVGPEPRPSRLWLWFVAAFLVQAGAWIAWFIIAANHQVAEVPLAAPSAIAGPR